MLARFTTLFVAAFVALLVVVNAQSQNKQAETILEPTGTAPDGMKVDPNHPLSCEKFRAFRQEGKVHPLKSSMKNFYLKPGNGSCGLYTNDMHVACVNKGWTGSSSLPPNPMNPLGPGCNRWVSVRNPTTKIKLDVILRDTCGDVVDSNFTCSDIYLSKSAFEILAGKNAERDIKQGYLGAGDDGTKPATAKWYFTNAPCEECYKGELLSFRPNGDVDLCFGRDDRGFRRCGFKTGEDRITDPEKLAEVCNADYRCPDSNTPTGGD